MTEPSLGEQNYAQFADRYAAVAETKPHNAYYDRPAVQSLLGDVRGLRALDAGCGPGIYAEWLVERGASVVAFDVTPRMVEITRSRLGDRAQVHRADVTAPLDFAAGTFDLVVCALVLDYVEHWGPVFAEFYRVLKPGGKLVFSCGHPASDYFLFHPDGSYFEIELFEMTWRGFGEPVVIRSYRRPLSAVLNPLVSAGFILDHLLEPQPTQAYQLADPNGYARLMRTPNFMCVRARKPEEG